MPTTELPADREARAKPSPMPRFTPEIAILIVSGTFGLTMIEKVGDRVQPSLSDVGIEPVIGILVKVVWNAGWCLHMLPDAADQRWLS